MHAWGLHAHVLVSSTEGTLQATEKPGHQPSYNTLDLQSVLPERSAGTMVAQNLSECQPMPGLICEGAYDLHCLGGQEPGDLVAQRARTELNMDRMVCVCVYV